MVIRLPPFPIIFVLFNRGDGMDLGQEALFDELVYGGG